MRESLPDYYFLSHKVIIGQLTVSAFTLTSRSIQEQRNLLLNFKQLFSFKSKRFLLLSLK